MPAAGHTEATARVSETQSKWLALSTLETLALSYHEFDKHYLKFEDQNRVSPRVVLFLSFMKLTLN